MGDGVFVCGMSTRQKGAKGSLSASERYALNSEWSAALRALSALLSRSAGSKSQSRTTTTRNRS
jgi:hypothetical protein